MYSIDGLCPSGQPMGGYGFGIHLSPEFRDAVKLSEYTQKHIDRVVKTFGQEWLQKCGFGRYFDPQNCGYDAKPHAIPSEETQPSPSRRALRIVWGAWGIHHISVPGDACGLDITDGFGCVFPDGKILAPHNIDSWSQVLAILVPFTWIANSVILSASVKQAKDVRMPQLPKLTVTKDADGRFTADAGGPGAQIVGRGGSVLEAVGEYCLQKELVRAVCDPPELVDEEYRIHPDINRSKLVLTGCPRR